MVSTPGGGGVCVCSGGCLLGGGCLLPGEVYAREGGSVPGGVYWGGCLLPGRGVSAPRGVSARGCLLGGCLLPGRGVSAPGGCLSWGMSAVGGVCSWEGGCLLPGGGGVAASGGMYPTMHWGRHPPCGQTDACKNITFATSLRTVIISMKVIHLGFVMLVCFQLIRWKLVVFQFKHLLVHGSVECLAVLGFFVALPLPHLISATC